MRYQFGLRLALFVLAFALLSTAFLIGYGVGHSDGTEQTLEVLSGFGGERVAT